MRPPTYEPSRMPPKRKANTKEASGRLAARLPSLRQAPGGAWGCSPVCVGLQPGVREVAGALRAAGWAGEAPASVKNATKTGVEETWRSCRKSLRDEVKLTIVKPATIEMTSGWCQLLPKVAVSQCSACRGSG